MKSILLAITLLLLAAESADACSRCGLFGRRCRFAVVSKAHVVPIQQQAAAVQQINVNVNTPAAYGVGATLYAGGVQSLISPVQIDPQAYLDNAARLAQRSQQLAEASVQAFTDAGKTTLALQAQNQRLAIVASTLSQAMAVESEPTSTQVTLELRQGKWHVVNKQAEAEPPAQQSQETSSPGAAVMQKCTSCHSGATPAGEFSLDKDRFTSSDHTLIYRAIKSGSQVGNEQMRQVVDSLKPEERGALMEYVDERTQL